jgi:hypothetical protein
MSPLLAHPYPLARCANVVSLSVMEWHSWIWERAADPAIWIGLGQWRFRWWSPMVGRIMAPGRPRGSRCNRFGRSGLLPLSWGHTPMAELRETVRGQAAEDLLHPSK